MDNNPMDSSSMTHNVNIDPKTFSGSEWRYEHAWRVFNLNQELIRATDQKTYMLIVMCTLLVSFSTTNLDRFTTPGMSRNISVILLVAVAVAFFTFALGTLLARHGSDRDSSPLSLIFFAHIVAPRPASTYRDDFLAASHSDVLDDVLRQTQIIAFILQRKLLSYRRAWACIMLEVTLFLTIVVTGRFL